MASATDPIGLHHYNRWRVADQLEEKLRPMFPTLYCNVQPAPEIGFVVVKVSQRDPVYGVGANYVFENTESVYGFPNELLVARLWLVQPNS